jgi:plasmid stabilization system protein ParE
MNVRLYPQAELDLEAGFWFYEKQDPGAGGYFMHHLGEELAALSRFGGIHRKFRGYHRVLVRTFPFGIFYKIERDTIEVHAIIDLRRSPLWIKKRLRN